MDSKEVKLCGGRFEVSVTYAAEKFTELISFDKDLCKHDIMSSRDHASMLARQGLITEDDKNIILKGLDEIERGEFVRRTDVHMNIEAALTDLVGEPDKKLHTVRCSNGQVCTEFRLWCRDAVDNIVMRVKHLQLALKNEGLRLIVSGYIHLQRAQPVLPQHLFLAIVKQLAQYAGRLLDCQARMNLCPLVAALASTGMLMTSKALEYIPPMRNRANRDNDEGSNEDNDEGSGRGGNPYVMGSPSQSIVYIDRLNKDNEEGSNKDNHEGSGRGGNGIWIRTLSRVGLGITAPIMKAAFSQKLEAKKAAEAARKQKAGTNTEPKQRPEPEKATADARAKNKTPGARTREETTTPPSFTPIIQAEEGSEEVDEIPLSQRKRKASVLLEATAAQAPPVQVIVQPSPEIPESSRLPSVWPSGQSESVLAIGNSGV